MKKILLILFALVSQVTMAQQKPFVIPEIAQWSAGQGSLAITEATKIVAPEALQVTAKQFAEDCNLMFGFQPKVATKGAKKGDIVFKIGKIATDNKEGYSIQTTSTGVTVTAPETIGVYWATRTMLQIMEQSKGELALPAGTILDYPAYPVRGFMLDCARKYFPIEFLQKYVKFMSYYKMNTFQVHLNDNAFVQFYDNDWSKTYSAFRLESDTYPGLAAKDGHYTKDGFRDLQKLAEGLHVNIIPEIDVPAHSLAFSQYLPEIGSTEFGADHLDLFKDKTYEFVDGLFKEYLEGDDPVFRGPLVHVGTDEYSNKKPEVAEKFRHFTNHYIEFVQKYGKIAGVWGALTHAQGKTPVKVDSVLMTCWYNGYAEPDSMIKLGYDVISVPDGDVYIVPLAGYYRDYLDTKKLYENWTPLNIGNKTFTTDCKQIKGGLFAVWNDHSGNGISTSDVHHRVWPAMQTLSAKLWRGTDVTLAYDEFNAKRELLSEAPGVNMLGRTQKGLVMNLEALTASGFLPIEQIGYDYRVQFDVLATAPIAKGTVLTRNDDATFFLSSAQSGTLGFARDGYTYYFNYAVPVGQKVKLAIEGDSHSTSLYVNDQLLQKLDITYTIFPTGGHNSKRAMIKTLQFPLAEVGAFAPTVKITNFSVTKL